MFYFNYFIHELLHTDIDNLFISGNKSHFDKFCFELSVSSNETVLLASACNSVVYVRYLALQLEKLQELCKQLMLDDKFRSENFERQSTDEDEPNEPNAFYSNVAYFATLEIGNVEDEYYLLYN